MDADTIVARAKERAHVEAFDSDSFRDGLERLITGINANPHITQQGRIGLEQVAIGFLVNRMQISEFRRNQPELCNRKIDNPLFILGMPRTGTTMVSHLLALDPCHRSLLRWEAFQSVPPAAEDGLYSDPRCLALMEADTHAVNSPSAIHLERADLPIECIVVTAHDFRSILWPGMVDIPEYQEWFLESDMKLAYEYHKRTLQLLQSYTKGSWVLKAPSHALFMDVIRDAYPDARFIWTHRDPYRAMGSLCSLIASSRSPFATVEEHRLGRPVIDLFCQHLARPMRYEARVGAGSIYHLHYASLIRDPLKEMKRLYAWLGKPFTPVVEGRMLDWVRTNPQGHFGRHQYDLKRFGLSRNILEPYFETYIDRYQVAPED